MTGKALLPVLLLGATAVTATSFQRPRVNRSDPSLTTRGDELYRKGQPFSGTVVEKYENGSLYRETEYVTGRREGPTREYALNGRLIALGNFVGGKREGLQQGWFSEGPRRYEYHYQSGFLEGLQTQWHQSGATFRKEIFSNGVVTDKQIYFSDGKTFTNYARRDGRIYGLDGGSLCLERKKEGER